MLSRRHALTHNFFDFLHEYNTTQDEGACSYSVVLHEMSTHYSFLVFIKMKPIYKYHGCRFRRNLIFSSLLPSNFRDVNIHWNKYNNVIETTSFNF